MPRIKLLSCPFCGAPAEIVQINNGPYLAVACTNGVPDAVTGSRISADPVACIAYDATGTLFATQRDAAKAWNTRAGP